MGWWITLGVLVLLVILPLGVSARYNGDGAKALLLAGPIRYTLYPRKETDKKEEKQQPPKESQTREESAPPPSDGEKAPKTQKKSAAPPPRSSGGSLTDFLPLVQVGLDLLGDFRGKLRVDVLELKLILAGDDPCDLAVNYGRANAALGHLWPQLERLFVIKKRDVQIECDFTSDKTLVTARLDLTITLGRLIALVVWHGIRAVIEYFDIMNKRKGGAAK